MKTIPELFQIILTGDKEASRLASREVRKAVYSSNGGKYEDIKAIINGSSEEYRSIIEDFRQENFVVAVSVSYFLRDDKQDVDFLFPWFFHLLKHKNGNVRQSAVRMLCHELGPLTVHIRIPRERSFHKDLSPKKANQILFSLSTGLHMLVREFYQPKYKKYKYIDFLPSSPYKSIQLVLARMEDDCGEEYFKKMCHL